MTTFDAKAFAGEWQRRHFGRSTQDVLKFGGCVTCETPDMEFRSEKAKREYTISGMCQRCQGDVFGNDVTKA